MRNHFLNRFFRICGILKRSASLPGALTNLGLEADFIVHKVQVDFNHRQQTLLGDHFRGDLDVFLPPPRSKRNFVFVFRSKVGTTLEMDAFILWMLR